MLRLVDNGLLFLVQTVFNLYILIVMLRIILQWVGARFTNPISQLVIKLTNPVVTPLRKLIPSFKGIDIASFLVLLILEFIKLSLIIFLKAGIMAGFFGLVVMAFADILDTILDVFFFAILVNIILSWVTPTAHGPISEILYQITEPLLRPFRQFIPTIAGFDISPIPVLIILQLLSIVVTQPLFFMGQQLALA